MIIQHLVENIVVRNSKIIKYILSVVFEINITTPETRFFNVIFPSRDLPRLFSKKIYNVSNSLEEILKEDIEIKKYGDLLYLYKPVYPFNIDKVKEILNMNFIQRGKLYLFENLCMLFPEYLEMSYKTFGTLMCEEGYLPILWRYYLAIMVFLILCKAVSSIQSHYLLAVLEELFLINGGNKEWLIHGLKVVPDKLAKLARFNNIMAHQPWKLQSTDIIDIYKGSKSNWNFNEFVQASLILFYFHKLASVTECLDLSIKHSFRFKVKDFNIENLDTLNYDGYSTSEENETEFQTFLKKRDKKGNNNF